VPAEDWHPISPERKPRARRALRDEYERWIAHGQLLLTPDGGWPLGPPASTGETWSAIVYLLAIASDRIGRHSHATRSVTPPSPRTGVQSLADRARDAIERLAAAVIHTLADQIDETVLLSEASELVDEIADEDNGVVHASDAIGSLLHAQLVCAEDQHQLPDSERAGAAVRILAPLLAQHACLRRSAHPPVPGKIVSTPPPLDIAAVVAYCEQRVPPHALHQVRMQAVVERHAVTLVERRAPWRPDFGPEWTTSPVARVRWSVSRREWTLFCHDRNQRWHRYPHTQPSSEIATLLSEIDRDPTGIFWG
jgi:hypothetical protein